MNGNIVGSSILTFIIGGIACVWGAIAAGGAGFLSAIIFTIALYQFLAAMGLGGPGLGICALLVIAFEVFVMFCIARLFFSEELVLTAASYWAEPIAWGGAGVGNLWDGIINNDSDLKWFGLIQILGMSAILLGIWYLIKVLSRRFQEYED